MGQVFLFQTMSQSELDNWMRIINNACAYAFARHSRKENVLKALSRECQQLESNIDIELKMKKMGGKEKDRQKIQT